MDCEFEEKQYEQLMNSELAETGYIYPVGQVLESDLAIDAAMLPKKPDFWDMWGSLGVKRWRSGLRLRPDFWEDAEKELKSEMFPKFKCNLFIQYKRPEFIGSTNGREFSYWRQPYFRYDITQHQQKILSKLEEKTSSHALVTYACPSFHKLKDLWKFLKGKLLISNSNFVQPHILQKHERYSFAQSGVGGYACSEPRRIGRMDLLSEIQSLMGKSEFENNIQFVHRLAHDVKTVIEELDETEREGFFAVLKIMDHPDHMLGIDISTILAFNIFANTTWGIGYEARHRQPAEHYGPNGRVRGLVNKLQKE
jgi:hypothetical protein